MFIILNVKEFLNFVNIEKEEKRKKNVFFLILRKQINKARF
jgi:hypothetical protein